MILEVLHKISSHRDAGLRSGWSHRDAGLRSAWSHRDAGLRSAWSHRDDAAHDESSFSQCFQDPVESPLEFLET